MQHQRAGLEREEQVLGPSFRMPDDLPGNQGGQVFLHFPTQALLVEAHLHDPATHDVRLDSTAGGLDFGQLGHGWDCWAECGNKKARQGRAFWMGFQGTGNYLILVSLYATCLRATGAYFFTSILSGWRRLFLVVT